MNKKHFILNVLITIFTFSFFLLFVSCGSDEINRTPVADTGSPNENETEKTKPYYFWKVEKQGKVSYWLGTVHLAVSLFELPCQDVVVKKLENSDVCFVESIASKENAQNSYNALLSPNAEDFKQLDSDSQVFLAGKGLPNNLNYFAYVAGLEAVCVKETLGASAFQIMMDKQVQETAQNKGIPLEALDDSVVLTPLITSTTKEDVVKKIEKYPQCLAKAEIFFNKYRNGDLSLGDNLGETLTEHGLRDRNKKWLAKFQSVYNNYDNMFIAVGVAHFIGPFNLVDMLREEGFSVEQMSCPI